MAEPSLYPIDEAVTIIDSMLFDYKDMSIIAASELSDKLLDIRLLLDSAKKNHEALQVELSVAYQNELATPSGV